MTLYSGTRPYTFCPRRAYVDDSTFVRYCAVKAEVQSSRKYGARRFRSSPLRCLSAGSLASMARRWHGMFRSLRRCPTVYSTSMTRTRICQGVTEQAVGADDEEGDARILVLAADLIYMNKPVDLLFSTIAALVGSRGACLMSFSPRGPVFVNSANSRFKPI